MTMALCATCGRWQMAPAQPGAARQARKRWREARRAAGVSWMCIAANHAICRGWFGRLPEAGSERARCQCRCHLDEDYAA